MRERKRQNVTRWGRLGGMESSEDIIVLVVVCEKKRSIEGKSCK